jgi:hypothetical protein
MEKIRPERGHHHGALNSNNNKEKMSKETRGAHTTTRIALVVGRILKASVRIPLSIAVSHWLIEEIFATRLNDVT